MNTHIIHTFITHSHRSTGKRLVRRVTASPRTSITPGSAPGTPKRSLSYTPNRGSGPSLSTSDLSSLLTMIGNDEQGSSREGSPAGGVRLRTGDSGNSSANSSLASSRRRMFKYYVCISYIPGCALYLMIQAYAMHVLHVCASVHVLINISTQVWSHTTIVHYTRRQRFYAYSIIH